VKSDHVEVQNLSKALSSVGESISLFQESTDSVSASLTGPSLKKGQRLLEEALQFAVDLNATLREIRFLPPSPASVATELRLIASRIDASQTPDVRSVRYGLHRVLASLGKT
jgi:hypothetical protein